LLTAAAFNSNSSVHTTAETSSIFPETEAASAAAAEVDVKWLTFAESKLLPQRHEG